MVIGIDFDNTLIRYDEVFHRLAVEAGLIASDAPKRQKAVRDAARSSPDGDVAWQRLQGQAYGPWIHEATVAPGALAFLGRCRELGRMVHIISHKTRFASIDPSRTDLQLAAATWLQAQGFFSEATGLKPETFHCGTSRADKIALIRDLGCTHFIDDLEETFREDGFPPQVVKVLYAPGGEAAPQDLPGLIVTRSWAEIGERILHG